MKLRVYFRPGWIVFGLAVVTATFLMLAFLSSGSWWSWICIAAFAFYAALLVIALYSLIRCQVLERWIRWDNPERLVIISPHQDDCVICAGGIGVRNQRLGGTTFIVYLVQDGRPELAERRKVEARNAWALAGVPGRHLYHLDLLPPLHERDAARLTGAAEQLKRLIDEHSPTVLIMPMFEGGHIHHDVANHLVGSILSDPTSFRVYESPEYSPFLSLLWTPHRILSHCARWLFGVIAYYGPPDGIDDRTVLKVRLDEDDLVIKRKMLMAFASQNGVSLAETRGYPDRIVAWQRCRHARPFDFDYSFLRFSQKLEKWIPAALVHRAFPVQRGTIGREPGVTDLKEEFGFLENC